MTTRTERVVLELDDQFSSGMARAAAAASLLNQELGRVDGSSRGLGRTLPAVERDVDRLGSSSRRAGADLNQFTGRLSLLASAAGALGPALVPISAAAIPALSGVAMGLASAGAAAGTALLAFQGLGDALGALNDYQLDPSAENLAKVREEFEKVGPAGANFVRYLDSLEPTLRGVQNAAREGMFPGLIEGIDAVVDKAPAVEDFVRRLGTTMGDIAEGAGKALAGPEFADFFSYLDREAGPLLSSFASSLGNVAKGLADLMVAMAPATRDFFAGLESGTESFADWAANLSETEGFQEFLAYVQESGPMVVDAVGSIAEAIVAIVTAAAPIGQVVLPAVTALADAFAAIMGSDIGPTIMAAVAAMSALRLASAAAGSSVGMFATGLVRDMRTIRAQANVFGPMTREMAAARANVAAVGSTLKGAAPGMAAFALSASGLAESAGLANTAMLAAAGTMMAGPWGTAIGAGVGAVMDLKAANDEFVGSIESVQAAMKGMDAGALTKSYDDAAKRLAEQTALPQDALSSLLQGDVLGATQIGMGMDLLEKGILKVSGASAEMKREVDDAALGLEGMDQLASGLGVSTTDLADTSTAAGKAVADLGLNADVLAVAMRSGNIDGWVAQVEKTVRASESAAGRQQQLSAAIEAVGNDALSSADSAGQLASALEALFAPTLNAEAATDAWRASLQQLREQLNADAGFKGFSKAAMQNRDLTREYVNTSMERLGALAEKSTTTEADMAKAVRQTRKEFIDAGVAAGFNREEMVKRANAMKLTPKLVRTVFEAAGIDKTTLQARELQKNFNSLPKQVRTELRANAGNVPKTVDNLLSKYKLTEKQRTALLKVKDLASKDADAVRARLERIKNKNVTIKGDDKASGPANNAKSAIDKIKGKTITVTAQTDSAVSNIGDVVGALGRVVSKTVTVTVRKVGDFFGFADGGTVPGYALGGTIRRLADGGDPSGTVPGPRQPYGDKVLTYLAPGEEVISNRNGQADRWRGLLKAINANALAMGGTVQALAAGGTTITTGAGGNRDPRGWNAPIGAIPVQIHITGDASLTRDTREAARSLKELRKQSRELTKQVERETSVRDSWQSRFDEVASGVRTSMTRDLWSGEQNDWTSQYAVGSVGYARQQLVEQRNRANALSNAIRVLRRKGLTSEALSAVLSSPDPLATARELAALPAAQVRDFQRLYGSATQAVNAAATTAGQAAYGPQLAEANRELKAVTNRLERVEKAIKDKEKADDRSRQRAADRTGEKAGKAARDGAVMHVTQEAAKGRRNRRGN